MTEYHPVVTKIKDLLDQHGVAYKTFEHEAVRTSEEAAALRPEYSLSQGTKALIVRVKKKGVRKSGGLSQGVASNSDVRKNGGNLNSSCKESKEVEKQFVQIVVPGDAKFDPKKARHALGAKDIRFATEEEVSEITGGVQPGGVPPFGNLFGIEVYIDQSCLVHEESIFNAGDRRYSIAIRNADLLRVVKPVVVEVV